MQWRKLAPLTIFAFCLLSCKGADASKQDTPNPTQPPVAQSVEANAIVAETNANDLAETDEVPDKAVTPILVTGTYLTCVDLAVTKKYNYEERGRIVGCRLVDRQTLRQVAMERVARDWQWHVETPPGVVVEQRIDNTARALYPLQLELRGEGSDGKDILETLVKVTLDLIIAVDDPWGHILSAILKEFLQPIPTNQLAEQVLVPPAVDAEETPPAETPADTEPETATQEEQEESEQESATDTANPEVAAAQAELPTTVTVTFDLLSRPGGGQITMTPQAPSGLAISEEVFRLTGQIITESENIAGKSLHFNWRFPIELSFQLDGRVTCRAQGFVGSAIREVEAACQ